MWLAVDHDCGGGMGGAAATAAMWMLLLLMMMMRLAGGKCGWGRGRRQGAGRAIHEESAWGRKIETGGVSGR